MTRDEVVDVLERAFDLLDHLAGSEPKEMSMTDAELLSRKDEMENEYPHADRCPVCMGKRHGKTYCNHCRRDWPATPGEKAGVQAALVRFREKWDRDPTATVEEVQRYERQGLVDALRSNGLDDVSHRVQVLPEGMTYRPGPPPLMIFVDRPISAEVFGRIQAGISEAMAEGKAIIFEPGFTVYQLVDGRWQLVNAERRSDGQ